MFIKAGIANEKSILQFVYLYVLTAFKYRAATEGV